MPHAVILDVDGTLIDSVNLHAKAWQDALREFGHEAALDDLRRQIGKGGDQLLPLFLPKDELQAVGKAVDERRSRIFKERYLHDVQPFPMVRELLQRMQADGLRVALASSAKEDELAAYKKAARIEDLMLAQTSTDDAERSKPDPDILQAALQRLGSPDAEQVVVVGDTPYDAEAAGKAGLRTVGLLCGGWPEHALRQAGCIATYHDPADLLDQYDRSPLAGRSA